MSHFKLKDQFIRISSTKERLHHSPLPVLAITGGIASGKSTIARSLSQLGHPVLSADDLIKIIYQRTDTINFLGQLEASVISSEGKIDFPALRQKVFQNSALKKQLESFLYARLPDTFLSQIKTLKSNYLFYEVPLLFELNLQDKVDFIVLAYTDREEQIKRLIKRDNCSLDLAQKILAAQLPLKEKCPLSDLIIKDGDIKRLDFLFVDDGPGNSQEKAI